MEYLAMAIIATTYDLSGVMDTGALAISATTYALSGFMGIWALAIYGYALSRIMWSLAMTICGHHLPMSWVECVHYSLTIC